MSFEHDNVKILNSIVSRVGECAGDICGDRGWEDPQLRAELGEENICYLQQILAAAATTKVLEIGCGRGNALRDLRRQYVGVEFHGVDVALHKFTPVPTKGVYLHNMDAHNLDFPENHFDIAFSVLVFPYIVDKLRAMREVYRVIKPNGRAIIGISPSYFSPHGNIIIPSEPKVSDVFWDARNKAIIINKCGKSSEALNREYLGCEDARAEDSLLHSVLSRYK